MYKVKKETAEYFSITEEPLQQKKMVNWNEIKSLITEKNIQTEIYFNKN